MTQEPERDRFGADLVILVIASLLLAGSVYSLYRGVGGMDDFSQLEPVGTFASSRNDVRRKVESGFSWSSVGSNDTVFEGDSVFTGEESEAQITLKGGGTLTIDPKSLIVIRTRGGKIALDLQYGSLVGKVSGGIMVGKQGEFKEVVSKGAEVKLLSANKGEDLQIQVVKGEAELRQKNGASKKIKKDQFAQITKNAEPVIKDPEIKLVSPDQGKKVWLGPKDPLEFKWAFPKNTPETETRFEISRSLGFDEVEFSQTSKKTSMTLTEKDRPTGSFFWRVSLASRTNTTKQKDRANPDPVSRLTVYPNIPPTLLTPQQNSEISFEKAKDGEKKPVLLSWEDSVGSTGFEVQIARDEKFSQPIINDKVVTNSNKNLALDPGVYHWRVKGLHPERSKSPWSRSFAFEIKEVAPPSVPKLAGKELRYTIPLKELDKYPAAHYAQRKPVTPDSTIPTFEWQSVDQAHSYEVESSTNKNFAGSVKEQVFAKNTFAPRAVIPGKLFMRVRAKSEGGTWGQHSNPTTLDVLIPAPTINEIEPVTLTYPTQEELIQGSHNFAIEWSSRPYAAQYELQTSSTSDFASVQTFVVNSNRHEWQLTQPGDYNIRVRALDASSTPISEFSTPVMAKLTKVFVPPPPPPVRQVAAIPEPPKDDPVGLKKLAGVSPKISEPKPNTALVTFANTKAFVSFKWNPFKGAIEYELQISKDSDFATKIKTVKIPRSSFVWHSLLPEGTVYWRVRAQTKDSFTEWSNTHKIRVIQK